MPGFDRTGPMGMGPMTGRAAGYCAGVDDATPPRWVPGRGLGARWGAGWQRGLGRRRGWGGGYSGRGGYGAWGRGRGGWGWGWGPSYPLGSDRPEPGSTAEEIELQTLKLEAQRMEEALESIRQRLAELEQ